MGENRSFPRDGENVTETLPVPPQVLARWAALAGERSALAVLPRQIAVVAS